MITECNSSRMEHPYVILPVWQGFNNFTGAVPCLICALDHYVGTCATWQKLPYFTVVFLH